MGEEGDDLPLLHEGGGYDIVIEEVTVHCCFCRLWLWMARVLVLMYF